jgi:hypothetical protein
LLIELVEIILITSVQWEGIRKSSHGSQYIVSKNEELSIVVELQKEWFAIDHEFKQNIVENLTKKRIILDFIVEDFYEVGILALELLRLFGNLLGSCINSLEEIVIHIQVIFQESEEVLIVRALAEVLPSGKLEYVSLCSQNVFKGDHSDELIFSEDEKSLNKKF